ELKLSARKGFAGLMVNTSLKPRVLKYAGFEALVNKYVDIENILLELEEPYSTIILKRLFLETDLFVVKYLGLDNKEQARKLVKTAVNKAYTKICKYLERAE
ncbi:MAG: hypothetical protein RMI01_08245, partial [Thermodesulfovibrio sp.]|nr:hypothetical protein [Thermodesulfovibrio sp.]